MEISAQVRYAKLSSGVLILGCAAVFGQAVNSLTFEVASIKPSAPPGPGRKMFIGTRGGPGTSDPLQITLSNTTLKNLLTTSYDVQPYQIAGPAWLDTERFEIVVKVPPGTTKEQARVMWRNLLLERFGLVLHHESKEFRVEELVVAKGGPKLKESAADPTVPSPALPSGPPKLDKNGFPELSGPGMIHLINPGPNGPIAHTVARAQPLSQLATMLGSQLHRPVMDKTGLTGKYDFTLEFTPDLRGFPEGPPLPPPGAPGTAAAAPADNASEPGSNLAAAVQQQLGLKLVGSKAKLEVLVIDHANKVPSEN